MKHLAPFILLLLAFNMADAQFTAITSGTITKLEAAWAFDSLRFLIAGKDGVLKLTEDAGASWTSPPTGFFDDINDFDFVDADNGFAAADDGTLLSSVDGGASWSASFTGTPDELNCVDFFDLNHGLIATEGGEILETLDGGGTWTLRYTELGVDWQDITFADASIAVAVGKLGGYARSIDGGATWSPVGIAVGQDLNGIAFTSADTGYVAGNGLLYETHDGGDSWIAVAFPAPDEIDDLVSTAGHVFGSGELGYAVHRNPATGLWEDMGAPAGAELNALHFPDPCHGLFVGDAGTVRTWYGGDDCEGGTVPVDTGGTDTTGGGPDTTSTAIAELVKELEVYPNPMSSWLRVRVGSELSNIQVWSTEGSLIESRKNVSGEILLTGTFPPGMLLIRVETNSGSEVRLAKVLKME